MEARNVDVVDVRPTSGKQWICETKKNIYIYMSRVCNLTKHDTHKTQCRHIVYIPTHPGETIHIKHIVGIQQCIKHR